MSGDDWQAGDLALCIRRRRLDPFREGQILTVSSYQGETANDWPGLRFVGFGTPPDGGWGWLASSFRKIHPHTPDEFDREVIEHMLGKPVREPSA